MRGFSKKSNVRRISSSTPDADAQLVCLPQNGYLLS